MEDLREGNFRRRIVAKGDGRSARLAAAFNEIAERNQQLVNELLRVRDRLASEGVLHERLRPGGGAGGWGVATDVVNELIDRLSRPTLELNRVLAAVAEGDLTRRMALAADGRPLTGDLLELGHTVNGMVDQLSLFATEVTRVGKEIGTEGILGGQARVPGASGLWRDLTESVNLMALNLTNQVRDIARVATAVARGDMTQKIDVSARGEILELKNT
ncbi:HAMP domain-containing protein, partial [Actinocrispum wychmicini]|uniref:HAMP domain-containing protein n=1 Tax=Actinocrispum wychmicini TaxID=1213861 RepID=UPI001FB59F64